MNEFGEFIRNKRLSEGLTLKAVANRIGISMSYLSDIERGNRNPINGIKFDSLCKALLLSRKEKEILRMIVCNDRNYVILSLTKRNKIEKEIALMLKVIWDDRELKEDDLKEINVIIKNVIKRKHTVKNEQSLSENCNSKIGKSFNKNNVNIDVFNARIDNS